MQILKQAFFLAFLMSGVASLQSCDTNDGPLEEAAEDVDEAVDDVGDKLEEACEKATDSDCDKD